MKTAALFFLVLASLALAQPTLPSWAESKPNTEILEIELIARADGGMFGMLLEPDHPIPIGSPHLSGHRPSGTSVFLNGNLPPDVVDHDRFSAQVERIGRAEFTGAGGITKSLAAYKVLRFKLSQWKK